jgi:hypothetical protein
MVTEEYRVPERYRSGPTPTNPTSPPPARDHGHDFDEMKRAADRLDHYAHQPRRLHDEELGEHWRHESASDAR